MNRLVMLPLAGMKFSFMLCGRFVVGRAFASCYNVVDGPSSVIWMRWLYDETVFWEEIV